MCGSVARMITVLAFLALGLVAAPTALAGDPCYHGFDIPARTEAAETEIKLAPCAFAPTVAYVAPGSTVTFFNGPDFTHLITGANQEWGSRDVELGPGGSVSYRFAKAGVYPYACALHRGMSGAIVVGGRDAPVGGGSTTPESTSSEPDRGKPGGTASERGASAGDPTASVATLGGLTVAAAGAGVVVGAIAACFAIRRRRAGADPVSRGQ